MAHERPPIDWAAIEKAGKDGRLVDLLVKLPRERWAERDQLNSTFLHFACCGPNMAAVVPLVQSGLVDVNARDTWGSTPALWAASHTQPRVLEVLCAAGADLRARNNGGTDLGYAPVDNALIFVHKDDGETVRVLVANGVRLSTVRKDCRMNITPELESFERGVLRCRAAVVAMLRVKQAGGKLVRWDKFLLVLLAVNIWATRYDKEWQQK